MATEFDREWERQERELSQLYGEWQILRAPGGTGNDCPAAWETRDFERRAGLGDSIRAQLADLKAISTQELLETRLRERGWKNPDILELTRE